MLFANWIFFRQNRDYEIGQRMVKFNHRFCVRLFPFTLVLQKCTIMVTMHFPIAMCFNNVHSGSVVILSASVLGLFLVWTHHYSEKKNQTIQENLSLRATKSHCKSTRLLLAYCEAISMCFFGAYLILMPFGLDTPFILKGHLSFKSRKFERGLTKQDQQRFKKYIGAWLLPLWMKSFTICIN